MKERLPTLDYEGLDRERPPGFWAGLWPEVRSEFAEVPIWLLAPFLALVSLFVVAVLAVVLTIIATLLG